jgi:hypothetical protein
MPVEPVDKKRKRYKSNCLQRVKKNEQQQDAKSTAES